MARLRDGQFVWVTWLSKVISGEVKCEWAPWFRTRYQDWTKPPSDFQSTQWQIEHTQALSELVAQRSGLGESVWKEDQNRFRVKMTPTLTLSGKPDLVAMNQKGELTVYDVKTGKPRQSDMVQVMLYMLCLPTGLAIHKGKVFSGCIVYKDGDNSQIPPQAISEDFKKNARYFINLLDRATPPRRTPSTQECQYCDISGLDCSERLEATSGGQLPEAPLLDW